MSHDDFDFEPIKGLPAQLPEGERILWQGAPRAGSILRRVLHARWIGAYFGVLAAWQFGIGLVEQQQGTALLFSVGGTLAMAAAALALLTWFAWRVERTTVYTITTQRVVLRFGVALPMTVNVPFTKIDNAAVRSFADGTVDLPLQLKGPDHLSYLVLWPHARPWQVAKPQPMLRGLADGERVAHLLSEALLAAAPDGAVTRASTAQPASPVGTISPAHATAA